LLELVTHHQLILTS